MREMQGVGFTGENQRAHAACDENRKIELDARAGIQTPQDFRIERRNLVDRLTKLSRYFLCESEMTALFLGIDELMPIECRQRTFVRPHVEAASCQIHDRLGAR